MGDSTIHVFAGVNGSGKSSILGERIRSAGGSFYNPDTFTRELMISDPSLSLEEAQSHAWCFGRDSLEKAIVSGKNYAFETTLGGNTITRMLLNAAMSGTRISVFYIGLASVDLNIARVAARVANNGHDIPTEKITQRWHDSVINLCTLLPHLNELRVFDNSEAVSKGESPKTQLLLSIGGGQLLTSRENLLSSEFPEWAQPIAATALEHSRTIAL